MHQLDNLLNKQTFKLSDSPMLEINSIACSFAFTAEAVKLSVLKIVNVQVKLNPLNLNKRVSKLKLPQS